MMRQAAAHRNRPKQKIQPMIFDVLAAVVSKRAGEFAPQTDTEGGLLTPVRAAATNQTYIKSGGSLRHRSQRDRLAPVNGNVDRGRAAG